MNSNNERDFLILDDPEEIRELSNDQNFDREFDCPVSAANRTRLVKLLQVFSVRGEPFPTMRTRADPVRAAAQYQLWSRLTIIAEEIKSGPDELESLAEWIRGEGALEELGLLVQQAVGRLFVQDFVSTEESWAAACTILEAAGKPDEHIMDSHAQGILEQAKELLCSMVNGDLSAVNGIGVALHHIVDGLDRMRQLAANPERTKWSIEMVVNECLFSPGSVLRRAKADGEVCGRRFKEGTLVSLGLGTATSGSSNRDLVFLSKSWSRCPADNWVPALLDGVWKRARRGDLEL